MLAAWAAPWLGVALLALAAALGGCAMTGAQCLPDGTLAVEHMTVARQADANVDCLGFQPGGSAGGFTPARIGGDVQLPRHAPRTRVWINHKSLSADLAAVLGWLIFW